MATAVVMPFTATGTALSKELALPNCPLEPSPQQRTLPVAKSAQLWEYPAATLVAPINPITRTGTALSKVSPVPSCPDVFAPQHCTTPVSSTAQVCTTEGRR
jgi:hypothetical protein